MRFPFTFMGIIALAFGAWVAVYVAGHPGLEPFSRGLAVATIIGSLGFGAYVLVRRVRRGPQH